MDKNKFLIEYFNVAVPTDEAVKMKAVEAFERGIIFVDENFKPCGSIDESVCVTAIQHSGLDSANWSKTFRSFKDTAEKSIGELVLDQILHYFSTYGLESFGLEAQPYIPREEIDPSGEILPTEFRGFTIIRLVSEDVAKQYAEKYITTTKAPKSPLAARTFCLMAENVPVESIVSNEIKIIYCDVHNIVPTDGVDFLRYICYKTTRDSVLIKNKTLIREIKNSYFVTDVEILDYFKKADEIELAKIFYRYKPIILAFKKYDGCAPIINRVRRLAKKHHKPLPDVNLRNFSKLVREGRLADAKRVAEGASIIELIRLRNFYSTPAESTRVYSIRNGSTWVDDSNRNTESDLEGKKIIFDALVAKAVGTKTGQKFYIPSYINYSVPSSEKQFSGNLPWGTKVSIEGDKAFTAGIYWENQNGRRVDLDLHMVSSNGEHLGWNGDWRRGDRNILFSGDMTDATNGAAEVFYFNPKEEDKFILTVNNYTHMENMSYKFLVSDKKFKEDHSRNEPPIDIVNSLFPPINIEFPTGMHNMTVGAFNGRDFVIYGGALGSDIVPNRELNTVATEATIDRLMNMFSLKDYLELCGATVYSDDEYNDLPAEEKEEVIDLSPYSLNKTTILEIVE